MPPNFENVLLSPIRDMPFSGEFRRMAEVNKFKTLNDLLSIPVSDLMKKEKFTMHVYSELIQFLESNELLHLLKQY
jgi:hypothetical protein